MFTKKGDSGETDVIRKRVGKDSPLVNFLGDLDELNSFLGMAYLKAKWDDIKRDIERLQHEIFIIGEDASTGNNKIDQNFVKWIEERTIEYRKESGPVRLFVIPGGGECGASVHIARAVCRRVERNTVKYSKELEPFNKWIIVYLNRASSLLFSIAIVCNKRDNVSERIHDIGRYF
jgi:ATP:cob(I)alamin adenosyltransferase